VASVEAMAPGRVGERIHANKTERLVSDNQRLDRPGEGIGPYSPENLPPPPDPKPEPEQGPEYTVVAWVASWCGPCKRWQAKELPALLKAGFQVTVRDIDEEKAPESITSVPTIVLYRRGKEIQTKSYWKAKELIKYVDDLTALKMWVRNV
jgi:thiol-disulfide isomerase/thioredoxin